jgi:hypothetical protein
LREQLPPNLVHRENDYFQYDYVLRENDYISVNDTHSHTQVLLLRRPLSSPSVLLLSAIPNASFA